MGDEPAPGSRLMPSSTSTADAPVVFRSGKYRRLAKNVIWPGSACSMPAMPRISVSGAPSRRQASFCATSESFMDEAPLMSASLAYPRTSGERRFARGALGRCARGFQIGPALHDFSRGDAPDYDAAELELLAGLRIRGGPMISDHNFIVFRNHVFDPHVKVRKTLQRSSNVLNRARGAGRHSRRNVRAMVHESGSKIHVSDVYVLAIHELFKMLANKLPALCMGHSGFRVDRFHGWPQAPAVWLRNSPANSARKRSMVMGGRPRRVCSKGATPPPLPEV